MMTKWEVLSPYLLLSPRQNSLPMLVDEGEV